MFDYSRTELANINSALEPKLAWAKDRKAELEQLSNDSVRLLSCTENRLADYINKGFFKRCWYKLSGKTGAVERANQKDLIDMQKYAWQYLNLLNERDLMLAHSVITIKNNLRSLEILHEDVRTEINRMADKIYNRFCEHENRIQELETTTAIHSWLLTLKTYDYDKKFTPNFRLLRVINDFYSLKQKDWKNQEIRLLQKAIEDVKLPWEKEISLSIFINELIDEIEDSSLSNFTNLLYIGHGKPEQPIPPAFIAENISIPSYSALYQVAGTYTGSSEVINVLQDELSIDKKSAIKKVLSTFIRKQGIDLSVCLPLRDLAVELLSCMSLTKSLFELGNVEYIDDYIAVSKKDSTHNSYTCGTAKAANVAAGEEKAKFTDEAAEDKDNSFESYLRKAEKGDADAQFNVGYCYEYGNGVMKNQDKALEWFVQAANKGHVGAQIFVKEKQLNTKFEKTGRNFKTFESYLRKAEKGDADAQFEVAKSYDDGKGVAKDKKKAFEWYLKAAEQGHAKSQFNVGWCYKFGKGVSENKAKAFEWYMKAAEQGDSSGQNVVGNCYYVGIGISKDYNKAFSWYMKAAEQGHTWAQYWVAYCYYWGQNVPKNLIQAMIYFDKAAKVAGNYTGLAAIAFIKTESSLGSSLYIQGIFMDEGKKKKAKSAYGWNIKEEYIVVLYDSTFWGSGKEGFIITDDLVIITSTEPKKGYDLKRESHSFFNSDSYKKLPQDIKDSLGVLVQKYNEYSPNWK